MVRMAEFHLVNVSANSPKKHHILNWDIHKHGDHIAQSIDVSQDLFSDQYCKVTGLYHQRPCLALAFKFAQSLGNTDKQAFKAKSALCYKSSVFQLDVVLCKTINEYATVSWHLLSQLKYAPWC